MYELIKKLAMIHGVSGREARVAEFIKNEMADFADDITTDALGNLIVYKKGADSSKKVMLAAHMDEIGFIVTYIGEDGFIRFAPVGGALLTAAAYSPVVFENGRRGIVVPEESIKPEEYAADKFVCDIGAKTRSEAERLVKVGDCFVTEKRVFHLAGSRIAGHPLDDRVGCAVLIDAARRVTKCAYDTYFVFTVQEEVGLRGSKPAAFTIAPDIGIAVDVTRTGDAEGSPDMAVKLSGGVAIKVKDSSVICDAALVTEMKHIAADKKIKHQTEVLVRGGTDTASMQMTGCGCRAGCVSIPTRYIHSTTEMLDLKDVEAASALITAIVENTQGNEGNAAF